LLPWGPFPFGVKSIGQPRSFSQVPIPAIRSAFRVSHPLSGFIRPLPSSLVSCRNAYGVLPSKPFPRAEHRRTFIRRTTLLRLDNPAFLSRSQSKRPLRSNRLASETRDALLSGPPSNTEPNLLGAAVNIAPGSLLPWAFVSPGLFSTKGRLGFRLAAPHNLRCQRLHAIIRVHRGLSLSQPTADLSVSDRPLEISAPCRASSSLRPDRSVGFPFGSPQVARRVTTRPQLSLPCWSPDLPELEEPTCRHPLQNDLRRPRCGRYSHGRIGSTFSTKKKRVRR
jgi:hypothetical protein